MGHIELGRSNQIALRKELGEHSHMVGMSGLDAASEVPIVEQIQKALRRGFGRVVDVFRAWDEDSSGTIDKHEFRRALPLLGLQLERQTADAYAAPSLALSPER